jgi:hypothetical protein
VFEIVERDGTGGYIIKNQIPPDLRRGTEFRAGYWESDEGRSKGDIPGKVCWRMHDRPC